MNPMTCPACGAEVKFKSRISVFGVCAFCGQMLVRHDIDVEAIGKMAKLQEDSSPLQIGTSGKYSGRRFTIIGRIRQQWSDGNWNEWFSLFDDGNHGWLGEAQGFLMMSFDKDAKINEIPDGEDLAPGMKVQLFGTNYIVEDMKHVTCVGSEGELPYQGIQGRAAISVDLASSGSDFACLDYSTEGKKLFVGKYLSFEDFQFSNLRKIDGW